jgi:SAM-dependent methyltransferase
MGELLVSRGCVAVGIEVDHEAAEAARHSGAYEFVSEVDLDDPTSSLPEGPFDVLLCADVLEHLRDPHEALVRLRSLIAPTGRLILSLPNVAHFTIRAQLLIGRFRYTERGILDETHLHLYTYQSARALVRGAGLRIDSEFAGSNRFGTALSYGPKALRRLRGLLAYNIVLVAGSPNSRGWRIHDSE